jgi:hypothetical protein
MATNKTLTVTIASIGTNDTLVSYNIYSDQDGLLDNATPTEATNGHIVSLSDGVLHSITAKPVGTLGEYNNPSNAVSVDLTVSFTAPTIAVTVTVDFTPVLSNFNITNTNKDRVYFDVSADITGMTTTGFTISGKTISAVDTVNKYFTVSAAFTFWDNNTIRLDSDNVVYAFTMEHILNNISEPAATTTTRYVEFGASGTGTTIGDPMNIVTAFTNAVAGQTVYIKAGDYGNVNLVVGASGTITSPIKFIGYKTSINDIITNYYTPLTDNWSTAEMPTITGLSADSNTGIYAYAKNNIIFKNIQVANLSRGVHLTRGINNILDKVNIKGIGSGTTGGFGIELATLYSGNYHIPSMHRITNSNIKNCSDKNVELYSSFSLIRDCVSYCDQGTTGSLSTDYYFNIAGDNNIIINNYTERINSTINHGGYAYCIKESDIGNLLEYNLIKDNVSKNIFRALLARNAGCGYNVFKNNSSYGVSGVGDNGYGGISIFGGAHHNIFEYNIVKDVSLFIEIYNNIESDRPNKNADYNIIRNNIFNTAYNGIKIDNEDGTYQQTFRYNEISNNTFYNINAFFLKAFDALTTVLDNTFVNNIVHTVGTIDNSVSSMQFEDLFTSSYSDFYLCTMPTGTGNTADNPTFADFIDFVPTVNLNAPKITGVNYDYDGTERAATTTMGAKEIN